MRQAEEQTGAKRAGKSDRRRRVLLYRRIGAFVLVVMAVALAVYVYPIGLSPATLMWGAACVLLILEALMLCVDLPVSRALEGALGVACIALIAFGFLNHNYVRVDGRFVHRYAMTTRIQVLDEYPDHFEDMVSLQTLDMRGSTVTDFTPLYNLPSLERVDLRDNYAFDQRQHDALSEAQPECDIRWSVPVSNAHFDSGKESVNVSALNMSTSELRELFAAYPEKTFDYQVPLYGRRYSPDIQTLDLQGEQPDTDVIGDALELLPEVTTVDLRGVRADSQTVSGLCDAYPDVYFMFSCDVPEGEMTTEDTEVTVRGSYDDLLTYVSFLPYMPNLQTMDANAVDLTDPQLDTINSAIQSGKLKYSVSINGQKVSSLATELNLDKMPIASVEDAEKILARLPNLTRVSMCDCGLSEDEMGQLFDAHPNIKFIWWLEFGHYRLRTDATSFSTLLGTGNQYGYNDKTFACLRYCTDLMMLDLGHNHIKSLENFRGLKKLRVLILADNKLTDISPIADLEDLEFVELFLNDITDATPLTGLKNLMDLNIFYNPLYDNHKVLGSMTWLKRLWIGGCRLSNADVKALREALPDTKINVEGKGSTGHGWRKHPHYDVIKQMYEEQRYIPFEDSAPLEGGAGETAANAAEEPAESPAEESDDGRTEDGPEETAEDLIGDEAEDSAEDAGAIF